MATLATALMLDREILYRFTPKGQRTSHVPLLMSFHSMLQAVRSPFYSFMYQNDSNKQNFNQSEEALKIRTSAIPAEAR